MEVLSLRQRREALGLTAAEVAAVVGVDSSFYADIERNGDFAVMLTVKESRSLARMLRSTILELLNERPPSQKAPWGKLQRLASERIGGDFGRRELLERQYECVFSTLDGTKDEFESGCPIEMLWGLCRALEVDWREYLDGDAI